MFRASILIISALFSLGAQAHPDCQRSDSDPDGDGYGWENDETCLMSDDSNPTPSTYPGCLDANSDPDGDGFGWENGATCVVDDNTSVDTPDNASVPTPICQFRSSDSDGDGWGFENNASCRIGPSSTDDVETQPDPPPNNPPVDTGCDLARLTDFSQVAQNCSVIDLQGRTLSGDLRIDENNARTSTLTLQNGTIDGSNSSADACLVLNRGNVTLNNIRVQNCHFGIHVRPSSDRSNTSGRFDFNDVQVVGTEDHGILLGYHASQPVEEDVTLRDVYIRDIGVDGIAGDVGARSTFQLLGDSQISHVDQVSKILFNANVERICSPNESRQNFMGDCVHLQSMRGNVLIDGATCDHRDQPTKNGFILQNQHENPVAGSVTIRNSTVLMSDRCATDFGHSPPSRDSKGIQLDKISNIDLANNEIRNAFIGIVVNNGFNTCRITGFGMVHDSTDQAFGGTNGCNTDAPSLSTSESAEENGEPVFDDDHLASEDESDAVDELEQGAAEDEEIVISYDEELQGSEKSSPRADFSEGGCSHTRTQKALPFSAALLFSVLGFLYHRRT